jgi:hypothetical protein
MSQTVMRSVSSNFVALARGKGGGNAQHSRALRATTHMSNSVTQLFYVNPAGAMMAAPITVTGATLAPGAPAAPITLLMNWNPRRRSNGSVSRRRQTDTPLRNVSPRFDQRKRWAISAD